MAKFRYYDASMFTGSIRGTNDEATALNVATSEDDFVVDTETGEWILSDGSRLPIEELPKMEAEEDSDADEGDKA